MSSSPSSGGSAPVTDRTVRHGGMELAVRDHGGSGPALLLLHGAGRTLADWSGAAARLAADHRVIAMDLRAHGHSSAGSGPWTVPAVLDDIGAVLAAFGIPEALPVGHSLGGMLAVLYADTRPRTPGAVNLDGFGQGRPGMYTGLDPETVRERLGRAHDVSRAGAGRTFPPEGLDAVRAFESAMAEQLGFAPGLLAEGQRRALAGTADGRLVLRPERERALEMLDAMDELDLFAVYRRTTRPLLVVRAGRPADQGDQLAWYDELMAAYVKGLDRELTALAAERPLLTVRGLDATHAMLLERPDAVAAAIRDFVQRLGLRS
ncbi:alpha/beta fold hydrolase [Streptomyces cucumeris]|uniref:alpha/beta fold hydrolase n=1 Tax=Streptomyces cucumeris TaxID=2962890 RepID=UPI003D745437